MKNKVVVFVFLLCFYILQLISSLIELGAESVACKIFKF